MAQPNLTPSWLSIVTKTKRFSNIVSNNGNNGVRGNEVDEEEEDTSGLVISREEVDRAKAMVWIPKKRIRVRQNDGDNSSYTGSGSDYGSSGGMYVLPRSASGSSSGSSSSPGLLRCGSASSAEDDVSTSTLSAFSSSSCPSPKSHSFGQNNSNLNGIGINIQPGGRDQYQSNVADFNTRDPQDFMKTPKFTTGSNQISVIKSTSSYRPNYDEEPQDLSIKKPKRLITSDSIRTELISLIDDNCVQNLSLHPYSSVNASLSPNMEGPTSMPLQRENMFYHEPPGNRREASTLNSSLSGPNLNLSNLTSSSPTCPTINDKNFDHESNESNNFFSKSDFKSTKIINDHHGELIIVDVPCTSDITRKRTAETPKINGDLQQQPEIRQAIVKHGVEFGKEETLDAEGEVKNRRGRKKKDEDAPGSKYDCFLCSFTSVKENVLKNHMVRMHTVKGNRGNVKCTVCAYSCPSIGELRLHQEQIHGQRVNEESGTSESKVAYHACSHCTKKFRSQSQLEAHLRLIAQKQLWKDLKTRRMQ